MKATFEIEFNDRKEAENALKIIKAQKGRNSDLKISRKGANTIIYTVSADLFSPLRARATSLLRDLKVMKVVFEKSKAKE